MRAGTEGREQGDAGSGPAGSTSPALAWLDGLGRRVARALFAPVDRGLTRPVGVRATPFPQRDVRVGDVRLRYIDVPALEPSARTPALVLLPGHTSRIEEYDELVPTLARRRRVLVLDFPGSGYSDKPDRVYSLDFYERTLLGFLDALGLARADLAGGSLGGHLVLRLGHRLPERFPRLVAWAPAGAWEPRPRLADVGAVLRRSFPFFWPMVWGQSRYWYAPSFPGRMAALLDTFAYYEEVLGPGFVRMYWEMAGDQLRRTVFDFAPEIHQPTLLAWGDQDHGMDMGTGVARLHGLLPRAQLHVFPGARHSLAAEVPEALARLIDDFLASAALSDERDEGRLAAPVSQALASPGEALSG